jgi:hypothetical protein
MIYGADLYNKFLKKKKEYSLEYSLVFIKKIKIG